MDDKFAAMEMKLIQHGSNEYEQMIDLRVTQLLQPIGIPPSYIDKKAEQNDFFIGAFEKDEMIGCCILTPRDKNTVQLRQMAVRKDYRGRKVGAAIIEFAEEVAKKNNFSTLMMHARNPVIDFYKKCGYQIDGEEFFEVGIGHHKMKKQLS